MTESGSDTCRVLVVSDLHLEFPRAHLEPPDPETYDVAVFGGDINTKLDAVRWARNWADSFGRSVILICGNHEFFRADRARLLAQIREEAAQSKRLHFLERDEAIVNGVRFLGTTLWTDFSLNEPLGTARRLAMHDAKLGMNDFSLIKQRVGNGSWGRRFSPQDAAQEHMLSRSWLADKLGELGPSGALPTVVVTHHAPSSLSVLPEYHGDQLSPCYATELPAELFQRPALWIHGHMHSSHDYRIGNTRVICNPRGYPRLNGMFENPDFNPRLVIPIALGPSPSSAARD